MFLLTYCAPPATCPESLISMATLSSPPNVPKLVIPAPRVYAARGRSIKASRLSGGTPKSRTVPTTSLLALIAAASLSVRPETVPKSVMPPPLVHV